MGLELWRGQSALEGVRQRSRSRQHTTPTALPPRAHRARSFALGIRFPWASRRIILRQQRVVGRR